MTRGHRTFETNRRYAELLEGETCDVCEGGRALYEVELGRSAFSPAYRSVICADCWHAQVERLGLNELVWRVTPLPR